MPRTTTATLLRAACRWAFITPIEQTTLSMPVSSSRLRKVTPIGGARPLAVGDEPADVDPAAGLGVGQLGDGPDAGAAQLVAQVLDRVAVG